MRRAKSEEARRDDGVVKGPPPALITFGSVRSMFVSAFVGDNSCVSKRWLVFVVLEAVRWSGGFMGLDLCMIVGGCEMFSANMPRVLLEKEAIKRQAGRAANFALCDRCLEDG